MKTVRKDALKTRNDLLVAASEMFAEKGYKDSTILEICSKAKTNVASVNYHYGNKETLYAQAWRYSLRESLKKYPPDGGVSKDASPEERFRGRIRSLVSKILDPNYKAFLIMQKELAQPTGLLKDLIKEELEPIHEKMNSLVGELLGPDVSEKQLHLCKCSVMAQCLHLLMMKQSVKVRDFTPPYSFDDVDVFVDHIVSFSLAGIKSIRKENSKKITDK